MRSSRSLVVYAEEPVRSVLIHEFAQLPSASSVTFPLSSRQRWLFRSVVTLVPFHTPRPGRRAAALRSIAVELDVGHHVVNHR